MKPLRERFDRSWIPVTESGCWLWLGSIHSDGYGMIGPKSKKAHRISWTLYKGPIPEGLCVLHKCDVRRCVNPDHLFLGTVADNNADKIAKGRDVFALGTAHGSAKLNPESVRIIRESTESVRKLAKVFGVHNAQIWRIRHRLTWSHIQ